MLCGSFAESKNETLELVDVDMEAFGKALDLYCGKVSESCENMAMDEVKKLASVADRFQITEIASALDETVMRQRVTGWVDLGVEHDHDPGGGGEPA